MSALMSRDDVRAKLLDGTFALDSGSHEPSDGEFCVMEAVAYIQGEEWSDAPKCVCPVISTFLRAWNDGLPDDATRTRLLAPLALLCVGTRSTAGVKLKRSWMAFDWLVRECAAEFLSLTEALKPHADALRALAPIDATNFDMVVPIFKAADSAVRSAAYSAAYSAARSAAYSAADSAALSAADSAARSAARSAALSAADSAVRSAADSAAYAALQPSVERLQSSATEIIKRMCAVTA